MKCYVLKQLFLFAAVLPGCFSLLEFLFIVLSGDDMNVAME